MQNTCHHQVSTIYDLIKRSELSASELHTRSAAPRRQGGEGRVDSKQRTTADATHKLCIHRVA